MNTHDFLAATNASCILGRWYVMRSPSDRPHVATSRDGDVHLTAEGTAMRDALQAAPPTAKTKLKTPRKVKAQPLSAAPAESDVDDAGASDQLGLQCLDMDDLDAPDASNKNET